MKLFVERWRINGRCRTWDKSRDIEKREAFETPIKNGFGNMRKCYAYLNDLNADGFHLADECEVEKKYSDGIRERIMKEREKENVE